MSYEDDQDEIHESAREVAHLRAKLGDLRVEARTILEGFEKEVFVRNVKLDDRPGWALKLLPYLKALARMQEIIAKEG